jgi:hypothetical protein
MEKKRTLLEQVGQDMANAMTPAQRAEAKQLWETICSEGITEQNSLLYQDFCATVYKLPVPSITSPYARKDQGSVTFIIKKKMPQVTQFVLFMLPRERREDVLADIGDWYPAWCAEFGVGRAKFLCWWHFAWAIVGTVVDIAVRLGEAVSRVIAMK